MNLFQFLEEFFFVHFFDMERLKTIEIPIRDNIIMADEVLYFLFSLAVFVLGVWLVIWLPVRGIRWLARGGRK